MMDREWTESNLERIDFHGQGNYIGLTLLRISYLGERPYKLLVMYFMKLLDANSNSNERKKA